jgi:hypothetical protein
MVWIVRIALAIAILLAFLALSAVLNYYQGMDGTLSGQFGGPGEASVGSFAAFCRMPRFIAWA